MGTKLLNVLQRLFGLALVAMIAAETLGLRPPEVAGPGKPLMDALVESGYVFFTIRIVYVLAGAALLFDRFAPLGAVVLFPIGLNILLFHAALHRASLPQASAFFALNGLVLFANRAAYAPLFRARAA